MLGFLNPDPWGGLPTSLWPNQTLDPQAFRLREALVQEQAKEQKLEVAIAAGRMYGLARDHYTQIRRLKLEATLKRPGDAAY